MIGAQFEDEISPIEIHCAECLRFILLNGDECFPHLVLICPQGCPGVHFQFMPLQRLLLIDNMIC